MHCKKLVNSWHLDGLFIITGTAGGTSKHIGNELELKKLGLHIFCDLLTFFVWVTYFSHKTLGLNNVTYVFHNVVQVALLGRYTVNIVMYTF